MLIMFMIKLLLIFPQPEKFTGDFFIALALSVIYLFIYLFKWQP